MLVKSKEKVNHIIELGEAFNILHLCRMKLNPGKCTFDITTGKFLGFMVTWHGIKANPKKIQVIIDMKPPASKKEVQ